MARTHPTTRKHQTTRQHPMTVWPHVGLGVPPRHASQRSRLVDRFDELSRRAVVLGADADAAEAHAAAARSAARGARDEAEQAAEHLARFDRRTNPDEAPS